MKHITKLEEHKLFKAFTEDSEERARGSLRSQGVA